jgi:Skp family chaperone for outer membrane proteins
MIKKSLLSVLLILGITLSLSAEIKYGFVDLQKVADEHPVYKQKISEIEKLIAPEKKELENKREELEKLVEELESNPLASETIKNKQRENIQKKQREFQQYLGSVQRTIQKYEREKLSDAIQEQILVDVNKAVQTIAKKEGFQVIYDVKNNVVYTEPSLDITERTIEQLLQIVEDNK